MRNMSVALKHEGIRIRTDADLDRFDLSRAQRKRLHRSRKLEKKMEVRE